VSFNSSRNQTWSGYFFIVMFVSGLECSGRHYFANGKERGKAGWISFANPLTYQFPMSVVRPLSKVSSVSQVSAKVVDAIQSYAEAEAPVNQSGSADSPRAGRTVQMQMLSSTRRPLVLRDRFPVPSSGALQAAASTPGVFQTDQERCVHALRRLKLWTLPLLR
jgi:hypothetical protein